MCLVRRSLVEAAALALLFGLAVLDGGPRAYAGFLHGEASAPTFAGGGEDVSGGNDQAAAAHEVPFALPPAAFPAPGPRPGPANGGAGTPSSPPPTSGPSAPLRALDGCPHDPGRESPPLVDFLPALERGPLPHPFLSSIFHPPRPRR